MWKEERMRSYCLMGIEKRKLRIRDKLTHISGLGFNIVGGTDQQQVSNDSGIYVSRIKENGAAALDGRLQEGDKILSLQEQNGPIGHRGEGEPSGVPIAMVLLPVFALTMVAAWAFMRYRQHL
ncbi:synaptojanin-2-binding protein isoform X3 [Ictidomys tridecemlineatus]